MHPGRVARRVSVLGGSQWLAAVEEQAHHGRAQLLFVVLPVVGLLAGVALAFANDGYGAGGA